MALCPLSCSLLAGQQAVRAAGAVRLPGPVMFLGGMLVGVAVVASLWRGRQGRSRQGRGRQGRGRQGRGRQGRGRQGRGRQGRSRQGRSRQGPVSELGAAAPMAAPVTAAPVAAAPVTAAPVAAAPVAAASESCLFRPGTGRADATDFVSGLVRRYLDAPGRPQSDSGVTVAVGPRAIVEQLLCRTAAALAAEVPPTGPDVILVAFPEVRHASGRITRCDGLSSALDRVASMAVSRPGQGDPAGSLPVLVSRVPPTPAELALLVDLAAETGLAALVPTGESCHRPGRSGQYQELLVDQVEQDQGTIVITVDQPGPTKPARRARPTAPSLRIGVLGTLTVNGQAGGIVPAQSQLILALALAGSAGLSNRQLCERLGPDPDHPRPTDSLRQLIARTRRQLGQAADGREWIEHRGHGQYALHPAAETDWFEFDALASAGISGRDAALLTEALSKVRGEPFAECYYWWIDLAMIEDARDRIVAAAAALAEIRLADQDPGAAARAARLGLAANASAEQLWRALMRAEHASGNLTGVREAWGRCQNAVADIAADGRPDPDTAALYDKLVNIT